MKQRFIAFFLAFVMLITVLPVNALAADSGSADSTEPQTDSEQDRSLEDWLRENEALDPIPETPDEGQEPAYLMLGSVDSEPNNAQDSEDAPARQWESESQDRGFQRGSFIRPEDPVLQDPEPFDGSDTFATVQPDVSVQTVYGGTCGDNLHWSFDDETGVLTITGTGDMYNYNTEDNPTPWTVHKASITALSLPEGLTKVGNYAFAGCTALQSVTVPDGVKTLGAYAFYNCTALVSAHLPISLNGPIPSGLFESCTALETVNIPTGASAIGYAAFYQCAALKSVTLPEGILSIGDYAFREAGLTEISIPDSVSSIGLQAFLRCSNLVSVSLSTSLKSIGNYAFYECVMLTELNLPAGVESVGVRAFQECSSLASLNFPNGMTEISEGLCINCKSLLSANLPETISAMGSYAFYGCSALRYVSIPSQVTVIPYACFYECVALDSVTIPDAVQSIADYAFYKCTEMSVLDLGSGVESLGEEAFYGVAVLYAAIPASVQTVGTYCFSACTSLIQVTFRGTPAALNDYCFSYCDALKNLTFMQEPPAEVGNSFLERRYYSYDITITCYEDYASFWAPNGETTWLGRDLTILSDPFHGSCGNNLTWTFDEDSGVLTIEGNGGTDYGDYNPPATWIPIQERVLAVELPAGLTSLSLSGFYGFTNLLSISVDPKNTEFYSKDGMLFKRATTSNSDSIELCPQGKTGVVDLDDSVRYVGYRAFYRCKKLTGINFPQYVYLNGHCFEGCSGLNTPLNLHNANNLNYENFLGCTAVPTITVDPTNVNYASDGVALFSKDMTTLMVYPAGRQGAYVIPDSVKYVGSYAFRFASGLTGLYFPSGFYQVSEGCFYGCTGLTEVNFPGSLSYLESKAFMGCSRLHYAYFKGEAPSGSSSSFFNNCASDFCVRVRPEHLSSFDSSGESWKGYPLEVVELQHCGNDLIWEYEPLVGILTIEGTGPMYSYNDTDNPAPWHEYAADIVEVTLPDSITSFGSYAFQGCALTEFTVPASIEQIQAHAFDGCNLLQKLTVNATLQQLGDGAFANNTSLTNVTFTLGPPSVLGEGVFSACADTFCLWYPVNYAYIWGGPYQTVWNGYPCRMYGDVCGENLMYVAVSGVLDFILIDPNQPAVMTEYEAYGNVPWKDISYSQVNLPEGLQNISAYALQDLANLTSLVIPSTVKSIGYRAFYGCTALTDLNLPADLESFDTSYLNELSELTAVNVTEGGSSPYSSIDGMLFIQEELLSLVFCPVTKSGDLTLPEGVQKVKTGAFKNCNKIKSLIFPESLIQLEEYAIGPTYSVTSMTFLGDQPTVASGSAINNCSNCNVVFYTNAHAASWAPNGETTWMGMRLVNMDTMNDPVSGDCGENLHFTFYPTENLMDIWADEGTVGVMTEFASSADVPWRGYYQPIKTVVVRGNVQNIGQYAFYCNSNIQAVTLPEGLLTIGKQAFRQCTSLQSITIPNTVTSIGNYAFYSCEVMQTVKMSASIASIGEGAFGHCICLTSVIFEGPPPTSIGSQAFQSYMSDFSLYYRLNYADAWSPSGQTTWAGYPIALLIDPIEGDCGSSVHFVFDPDTRTLTVSGSGEMDNYACPEATPWVEAADVIQHVVVENGVSAVGDYAFADLPNLEDLSLPGSVARIGAFAFRNLSCITAFEVPPALTELDASTFFGCDALESFQVAAGNLRFTAVDGALYNQDGTVLVRWPNAVTFCTIPEGVLSVGPWAFAGSNLLRLAQSEGGLQSVGAYAFSNCPALTNFGYDPESLNFIGEYAIYGCKRLNMMVFFGQTSFSDGAFADCSGLDTVVFLGLPEVFGQGVFDGCADNFMIMAVVEHDEGWYAPGETEWHGYPIIGFHKGDQYRGRCGDTMYWAFDEDTGLLTVSGVGEMYDVNDYSSNYLPWTDYEDQITAVRFREGVTCVGSWAFCQLENLTSVSLPATLEWIGECGLHGNAALETLIVAPNGGLVLNDGLLLTADGESLLLCVPTVAGVCTVPEGTLYIAESAFELCTSITEVVLPDGLEIIEDYAFYDCASMSKLTALGAPPTQYAGSYLFTGCAEDFAVWCGEAYEGLWDSGDGTWLSWPLVVVSEELPISEAAGDNLNWSFDEATGVLSVNGTGPMYDFITVRPPWYEYKDEICEVRIDEGVTTVGAGAFQKCLNLFALRLPDSLAAIGAKACYGCTELCAVVVPAGIQVIGDSAFAGLNWTQNYGVIFLGGPPAEMGNSVFQGTTYGASILEENMDLWLAVTDDYGYWEEYDLQMKLVDVQLGERVFMDFPTGKKGAYPYSVYVYGYGDMWDFTLSTSNYVQGPLEFSRGITSIGDYAFTDDNNYYYGVHELIFPDTLLRIGKYALNYMPYLESVSIPASVTEIGDGAFALAPSLGCIEVSEDNPCFQTMEEVLYSKDLSRILRCSPAENNGGYNPKKGIDIPESINPKRFSGDTFYIPEGVTHCDSGAFAFVEVHTLNIPASLTELGDLTAFVNGDPGSLLPTAAVFIVEESNPAYASSEGLLYNADFTELLRCSGQVTEATVPATVTKLAPFALLGCQNLECLNFYGPKPTETEESAFHWYGDYYSMPTLYYLSTYADSWAPNGEIEWYGLPIEVLGEDLCGDNVHWRFTDGTLYLFGSGPMYSYFDSESGGLLPRPWDEFAGEITEIIIDDGVTVVGEAAFAELSAVESLYMSQDLINIQDYAFLGCSALTSLELPDGLVRIGAFAFAECTGIALLHFPASVSFLGQEAFSGCYALTKACFEGPAPEAGENVFQEHGNSFYIRAKEEYADSWAPNGESTWQNNTLYLLDWNSLCGDNLSWTFIEATGALLIKGSGAMYDYNDTDNKAPWNVYADRITALYLPTGLTRIGSYAFADCTAVTSVSVPDNVVSIYDYAFRGCSELVTVELGARVAYIDEWAFRDCAKLTTVTNLGNIRVFGDGAFYGCSSLTGIEPLEEVRELDAWAFSGCSSLQEVTLGLNLHTMKVYSFQLCSSLTRIVFEGPVPNSTTDYMFSRCHEDLVLYYKADYANSWAPNGETTWRGIPIALDTEVDISTSPISLTRLFYPNKYGTGSGDYLIYQYLGSETTHAYLYSANAYGQSDSFTATFYRADDSAFTQNVEVMGTVTTDRLSEYDSVDDAIFDLGLKIKLPSDEVGEYWVRADYSNTWQGKTHSAQTNAVRVVVEDKTAEDYFEFDADTNTITGYYGTEETVVFPAELGGVPVKKLSLSKITNTNDLQIARAFGFRNVVFPEGLEIIDNYCFAKEKYLGDISFPDSLYIVGAFAFYQTPKVKKLTFGAGQRVSWYNYQLNSNYDYTLLYFYAAFNGMTGLETVDMSRVSGIVACPQCGYSSSGTGYNITGWAPVGSFRNCPNITRLILPEMGRADFDKFSFNVSEKLLNTENIENYEEYTGSGWGAYSNIQTETVMPIYTMGTYSIEHVEADDNFIYVYDEARDGYVIVSVRRNITDTTGTAEFPATFNGKPVVRIGYKDGDAGSGGGCISSVLEYFCDKKFMPKRVVIPQGVKEIGYGAFSGLYLIETLELPQSIHSIGSKAFYTEFTTAEPDHYIHLTEVNLNHASLSYVGDYAFYNSKLANFGDLDFIAGASVGDYAFAVYHDASETHNDNLSSITAHGSLSVGVCAFSGRWNLRSLTVNGSLMLGQDAFDGCYWLENVSYEGEIVDGDLVDEARGFSHFRYTLARPMVMESESTYTNNSEMGISFYGQRVYCRSGDWCYTRYYYGAGNSTEYYEKSHLDYCLTLEDQDIVIPSRITDAAGEAVFETIDLIYSLTYVLNRHPYTLYITDGITKLINQKIQTYGNIVYYPTPVSLSNCSAVRFPETLPEIPVGLFWNSQLTGTVEIPASVKKIGIDAFAGAKIDTVILHEGLETIGAAAFCAGDADYDVKYHTANQYFPAEKDDYRQLTRVIVAGREENESEIQLPNSLKAIGKWAFAQTSLSGKLTVTSNVTDLGDGAFFQTGISEVKINAWLDILGNNIYSAGSQTNLEVLSFGVFNDCPLTKVDLSDAVISNIAYNTFNNEIHSVGISETTFETMENPITELKLPRRLLHIGYNSFAGVDPALLRMAAGLKTFYVEYPTDTLNGKPVSECSVTLPETVTTVHSSIFNLGTVTFYNQTPAVTVKQRRIDAVYNDDDTFVGFDFVDKALPNSIPAGCLIRCYEGSFIHNWCMANNLNYELIPEQPTTLKLQVYADDGRYFNATDFSRIDWIDETDGCYLRFDTLTCPVHEFKADHVYSVRVSLTSENYEIYDLDYSTTLTFDPSAEDFDGVVYLKIYRRQAVTVVGTFGDQRNIDGFWISARSIKNDATTNYQDVIKTYPVTLNSDGSFSVQVPSTKVDLVASVSADQPYLPLTVKNIAYKAKNDLGQIDLGELTLPAEQIIERIPVSHTISGVTRMSSPDGTKYAEGSINISNGQYYINLTNLREDFAIGETVVIRINEGTSANGYAPYTLTLPGEKASPSPITLTPAQNAKVVLPERNFPIKLGAFDADGRLTAYAATNTGFTNELYLPAGSYTLVAFQNSGTNSFTLPDTLAEFEAEGYELAGYAREEVTLSAGQEYEFDAEIPGYVVRSAVTVSFTENPKLADKETASYPVWLHFAVSEEARSGDITFRLETRDNTYTPFSEVGDAWAYLSAEGGTKFEVTKTEEFGDHGLQVVTDVYEGAICFYVKPSGQALRLLINGEYKMTYVIPGMSFSVSAPQEKALSRNGSLTLNYTNAVPATAKVYVDGEEVSAAALNVGAANKALLHYTLPETETETTYQLQVKVFNSADQQLWESYEFPVTWSDKPVPVPQRMDIRIANGNAAEDGVPRVTNASYDFSTGEAEKMKLLILTENYLPNGTMAGEIEFSYYLHVQNPELVAYGEVYLKVWCNEEEPKIFTVPLAWNETSGTFDGTLLFKGGTRTPADLPFGFDLEVPTERTAQEATQEAVDAVNEWGELLTAELDPELVEFYENSVNVDDLRFVLEHGEEIENITDEEREAFRNLTEEDIQNIIELAEIKNEIAEVYSDMATVMPTQLQEVFSDMMYEDVNDFFAAMDISAVKTTPSEGTTRAMLLSEGYTEMPTDYGVFYFKQEEARIIMTCLDPLGTYIIAQDSHALNPSVRGAGDSDAYNDFLNGLYSAIMKIDSIYDWTYARLAAVVQAIDLITAERFDKMSDLFTDFMQKITTLREAESYYNTEKALWVLERNDKIKWINATYAERQVMLKSGYDLFLGTNAIDKEISEADSMLKSVRNEIAKLVKETNPEKLLPGLNRASKILGSKAMKVIPFIGGVVGIVFGILELVITNNQWAKTIKNLWNDNPLLKWEAIYCHKLLCNEWYTKNYYSDGSVCIGAVADVLVGEEGDTLQVSEAALNRNYLLYYLFALCPEPSFIDLSDYFYAYENIYYSKMKTAQVLYANYYDMEVTFIMISMVNACVGFASHPYVTAASLGFDVGMWGMRKLLNELGKGENAILEDVQKWERDARTEVDEKLGPRVENAFSPTLNWWNMWAIRQGFVQSEAGAVNAAKKCFPSILYSMYTVEASADMFISIDEYADLFESAYLDNKYMRALDNMENMFASIDFNYPDEEYMTPNYQACVDPALDPSGYVYEAVASNRIEGATARLYYQDKQGNEQYWAEAEDYDEINPQITDSFGEYGWMTPIGKWKVYVEKDGYLTADSSNDPAAVDGWLPVPPPQLNVNIGLVSTAAPEVSTVAAAADRIQVAFSQYMDIAALEANPNLLTVTENGAPVELVYTFADCEESPTQEGVFYGRVLTVTRTDGELFTGDGLNLHVGAAFQNYAGTPMTADYEAESIHLDQIVGSIEHEYSNGYVGTVGAYTPVAVTVLDTLGNPVAGETVTLSAAYGDLYQVESCTAVTDENGVAHFSVMAIHDGTERFTFTTPNGVSADVSAALEPLVRPHEHSAFFVSAAEPTCTEPGHMEYWRCVGVDCELNDKYFADEEMTVEIENVETSPALGHDFVDGTCTRCGAPDPDYHPMLFTDVAQDAYYADAVQWAVENGVTAGTSETTFSPNQGCTRAQIVTFLWRAAGSPAPTIEDVSFTDVPKRAYYYDAVRWAVENGITSGVSESSFCPGRTCTRSEAMTFLWRAAGSPDTTQTESPFTDVPGDIWYTTPVLWAVENGITVGTSDTTFSPLMRCTRAQIVTFLWHASQISE